VTSVRRIVKDALIYGSGDLVLRAGAFITIPIYTRLLTPSEYGVWTFLITAGFLLGAVLIVGGDSAYARFFFATDEVGERRSLTSTWLGFLALWSFGVVLVLLPFAPIFSDWAFGTRRHWFLVVLALLTAPVTVMSTMFGQVIRNQFRPVLYGVMNVAATALGIGLSLFLVLVEGLRVTGVMTGMLVAAAVLLPVRAWAARAMLRPVFDAELLKRVLRFGVPLVPASIAGWVMNTSDRVVLAKLSTFHEVGLYSLAFSVVSILFIANTGLGLAWLPHAVQAYQRDPDSAASEFGRIFTYLLAAFGTLAVLATTFAHEILVILTVPEFYGAERAIAPLALATVAYASAQVTGMAISLRHRTGIFPFVVAAVAVGNVALNVAFVPKWGMLASAWATAASYVALTLAYFMISRRLWRIRYDARKAIITIVAILAFVAGARLLPWSEVPIELGFKALYVGAFIGALLTFGVITPAERRTAEGVLRARALRRS
jgi:O-antigen/teichoic acid export membrane protein